MSVELIRKPIQLNELTKQETIQTVKERDLIVPDGKPDMQRVIYLDGNISIDQMDVQDDRVVYKGQVDVTILYACDNNTNAICMMKGSIPLEDFIIMEGVDQNQRVALDYNIEHLHWNILNERKICVKAIIQVTVASTKPKETMIITGIEGLKNAETKTKNLDIMQSTKTGQDSMMVKDELTIMQGKDCVSEILKMDAEIKEEQLKRTDTEILYNGIVELHTLYKGQGEDNPLQVVTHRVPFAGSLDVIRDDNEMYWDCSLEAKPIFVQVQPDYDGEDRIIEVECMINSKYNVYNKMNEEIVDDVYCPGKKINMTNKEENYMTLVTRGTSKASKKEMMNLETQAPEDDQIFTIKLTPRIDEKEIQNDKLTVKGMMEVKVTYLTDNKEMPVQVATDMLPFTHEMVLPGIAKGNYVDMNIKAKDVHVSPYNKTDLMLEYVLDCVADVYKKDSIKNINEIEAKNMDKEEMNAYPSITVYVVKKGDTLWDIAKRFNTTVKEIQEINELDASGHINPSQKLIILKKTKF